MFKVDMSGIKGALVGLASGLVAAGFGGHGAAVFGGTVGAFCGHLWWSQLNGLVAYPVFGTYLWRWDPSAKNLGLQPAPQSFADELGGSMQMITLPNGSQVPVYTGAPSPALPESTSNGLSDFSQTMGDFSATMGDYSANPTLGDYSASPTLGDYSANPTLGDYSASPTLGDLVAQQQDPDYAEYEQF